MKAIVLLAAFQLVGCATVGAQPGTQPANRSGDLTAASAPRPATETSAGAATLGPGHVAPDFIGTDIDGTRHQLSAYRGKVVLLYFWATWCGPCQVEAPLLKATVERYPSDLVVLGITSDTAEQVRASAGEIVHGWPEITEPVDGPITTAYNVYALPMHYVIDREGRVALSYEGRISDSDFVTQFERLFPAPADFTAR